MLSEFKSSFEKNIKQYGSRNIDARLYYIPFMKLRELEPAF